MRLLAIAILCTSAFVMAGEGGGAEPKNGSGTPEAAPIVQNQQQVTPHPFDLVTAGMPPLEVAGILGLESIVEVQGQVLTMTYWRDNAWMTIVFVNFQCVSKSKGATR